MENLEARLRTLETECVRHDGRLKAMEGHFKRNDKDHDELKETINGINKVLNAMQSTLDKTTVKVAFIVAGVSAAVSTVLALVLHHLS